MVEFNLSEKFEQVHENGLSYININDVKEFIRLLKEKVISNTPNIPEENNWYCNRLNELAGDKLI